MATSRPRSGPRLPCPLDPTDRRIVTAMQDDGRVSLTDLAATVHPGISATRIRLQALGRAAWGDHVAHDESQRCQPWVCSLRGC
ncbi:AsnC family transcriptional regulator [Cryobacterium sp. M15]|uniref:AsnC family transcriptional regulator n=1 Tax=Cryobacterium sp. M15 TaxID=2048291 RepID=UPI0035184FC3